MQTVNLAEFIRYEPAMAANMWVIQNKCIDVPIGSFVTAAIKDDIPAIQALGYLVERELDATQLGSLVSIIAGATSPKPGSPEIGDGEFLVQLAVLDLLLGVAGVNDVPIGDMLGRFNDLRLYWRDYRPRSSVAAIQHYLAEAVLYQLTFALVSSAIDDTPSDSDVPIDSAKIIEQLLGQNASSSLKLAFYHAYREDRETGITILKEIKEKIIEHKGAVSA